VTTEFRALIESLCRHQVDFVVIGGIALVLRGSGRTTQDLDLCYSRQSENVGRLALALSAFHPRLRGAPASLPFVLDEQTIRSGLNFTLTSEAGDVDLLGEVQGLGDFAAVRALSSSLELYGYEVSVLSLAGLERAKRSAGRLKDVLDLAEIAELRRLHGQ
jgi:hypothetical protein